MRGNHEQHLGQPRPVGLVPASTFTLGQTVMNASRPRILIVDDSRTSRLKLSRLLKSEGHAVTEAAGGREGLDLLFAEPFDLVLLDLEMPDMDGFQTLRAIKETPELRHLPVIIVSGTEDGNPARCLDLGATAYLVKPVAAALLKSSIDEALEGNDNSL